MNKGQILDYLMKTHKGTLVGSSLYCPVGYESEDTDIMCLTKEINGSMGENAKTYEFLVKCGFEQKDSPPYCNSIFRMVHDEYKIDTFFVLEKSYDDIKFASEIMRMLVMQTNKCNDVQQALHNKAVRVAIFEAILGIISTSKDLDERSLLNILGYTCWQNKTLFDDNFKVEK